MTSAHRARALVGVAVAALALAACGGGTGGSGGGGGGGNGFSADAHNFSAGGANVVAMTIGNGPDGGQNTFNIPYTSVTVCLPASNTCATINNVLVDTGSTGFRLLESKIPGALACINGTGLCPMVDPNPNDTGSAIAECLPFADGYAWGSVARAEVKIGGESAASVPIQIIDDSPSPSPSVPGSCVSGTALNSVAAFDANGVLGVGQFTQDCGAECAGYASTDIYYSCDLSTGQCNPATLPVSDQVANPVASFATDNNGVILQLPAIEATGAASASGYLVFGIGTQSNNALQGATVFATDAEGQFTTSFNGNNSLSAFLDSGSNALFFPDGSIDLCGQSGGAASFYCPPSTLSLSAGNQGADGTGNSASFQVANLNDLIGSGNEFAFNDAAGPAVSVSGVGSYYFDWGLPFFYGRTVFVAIEGTVAAGTAGPYFAY